MAILNTLERYSCTLGMRTCLRMLRTMFKNLVEEEGLRNQKVKYIDKFKYPQVLVIC